MAVVTKPPVVPVPVPRMEDHASEDEKVAKMTENYMRDYYAGRPKVAVRCAEDTWVQVNGYTFIIKGGERVMVPDDIAALLEESGKI